MAVGGDIGPDGVLDGTLSLRAYQIPEAARSEFWGFPYAAGMLSTEESHDQLYGYWETAIRINNLDKGMHFALWQLPQDNSWPPEIDMLEIVNNDPSGSDAPLSKWHNNAHGGTGGLQVDAMSNWQGWHKIGFEWTPTSMKWIYDGVVVREEANYVNKPMYFLATWEVGSNWAGATNQTTVSPGEVEFDYVRAYTATPGATSPGAPAGYTLTWGDEFNTPSIGTKAGDNFAPYFTDWGVRHLAGNNDQAIKVADGERTAGGGQTYGQALAATGVYGDAPYFHHYNKPTAPPPSGPSSPPATAIKVVVSGDADGTAGTGGPEAKFVLLVDGVQVGGPVKVTASHDAGQWQTLSFNAALDTTQPHQIGVKFVNDWANWKYGTGVINGEDRNLYVDSIQVGGTTLQAEQGRFTYASGGGAKGGQLLSSNGTLEFTLAASPPPPPPTALKLVVSGDADGTAGTGGPEAKFVLLVDGVQVGGPVKVTASHDAGQWQTLTFETGIDLSKADSIGVKFVNDWANWKYGTGVINGEDRNLYLDSIQFGGTTLHAEQGKFSYASGGGAKGAQLIANNGTLSFDLDTLVHHA